MVEESAEADMGVKKYCGVDKHGQYYESFKNWFGYKLIL